MIDKISTGLLWDAFKHLRSWLANLARASDARKQESIQALRKVVTAARETAVYIRQLADGKQDHKIESHLAVLWTDLGFALADLNLNKLAKRCQITGKQWASPDHYDALFIKRADVSLERMEELAQEILQQIK
jgi:hypothetical protein